jgi:hypothetical protein
MKHHMQVQFVLNSRNPERELKGSITVSVADNTRWDIVQAAVIKLMNEADVTLPTSMMSWTLNGKPEFVHHSSESITCAFKLPLDKIRSLKSTDLQIALGKYSITDGGYV